MTGECGLTLEPKPKGLASLARFPDLLWLEAGQGTEVAALLFDEQGQTHLRLIVKGPCGSVSCRKAKSTRTPGSLKTATLCVERISTRGRFGFLCSLKLQPLGGK